MEFYHSAETNLLRHIVNWIVDIIVVIAAAWFTVYSFGARITVAGHSMKPLMEAGDVVLMNRFVYHFESPKRFDVVVFERDDKKTNVKRIIGLPGERVQISGGQIYIDGEVLEADEELGRVSLAGLAEEPVKLGRDEYFLLGDNRDSSEDSRFANIGNVSRRQILGKVWFRISPFADIGIIRSK